MSDASGARTADTSRRTPILIDCDTGIDDSLALLYALASPDCELVAVTCTAGNVTLDLVSENTRAVLELAGRPDVPVAIGRDRPLVRPLMTTPETHGPRGIGYAELPPAAVQPVAALSSDLIVDLAHGRPGELTLVATAPLTNVALAVLREPALPRLLRRLVVMGGSYRSAGNTAPTTEWNTHCDPEAAKIVIDAWTAATDADASIPRPVLLGLDVTERAKMTPEHLARLAERASRRPDGSIEADRSIETGRSVAPGRSLEADPTVEADPMLDAVAASNPVVRFLADALRFYMEFHSRYDGFYGAFIHDALAVAAALDLTIVRTEAVTVDVELAGTLTAGETVADWRRAWHRAPNADVGVQADAERFFDLFVERVGRLSADRQNVAS